MNRSEPSCPLRKKRPGAAGGSGSSRAGKGSGAAAQAHFQTHWQHPKCEVFPDAFRSARPFDVEIPVEHREQHLHLEQGETAAGTKARTRTKRNVRRYVVRAGGFAEPAAGAEGMGLDEVISALAGVMPLEIMLQAMRLYWEAGQRDKATAVARDAAPYMHPRLTSVDVGGKQGQPIETKDVTNEELARRIAFILGQAAREKAEEAPLAAFVAGNGLSTGVN